MEVANQLYLIPQLPTECHMPFPRHQQTGIRYWERGFHYSAHYIRHLWVVTRNRCLVVLCFVFELFLLVLRYLCYMTAYILCMSLLLSGFWLRISCVCLFCCLAFGCTTKKTGILRTRLLVQPSLYKVLLTTFGSWQVWELLPSCGYEGY